MCVIQRDLELEMLEEAVCRAEIERRKRELRRRLRELGAEELDPRHRRVRPYGCSISDPMQLARPGSRLVFEDVLSAARR